MTLCGPSTHRQESQAQPHGDLAAKPPAAAEAAVEGRGAGWWGGWLDSVLAPLGGKSAGALPAVGDGEVAAAARGGEETGVVHTVVRGAQGTFLQC